MKTKMQRIISLMLVTIIMLGVITPSYAGERSKRIRGSEDMNEDVAAIAAILFVIDSLDDYSWDESTQITSVRALYGTQEEIKAYHVGLMTNEQPGYIVVSADPHGPLIVEYSDTKELAIKYYNEQDQSVVPITEVSEKEILYYSPLYCTNVKSENENLEEQPYDEKRANQYKTAFDDLISFIWTNNLSLLDRSCDYHFIADPVTFLQSYYSSGTYSAVSTVTVSDSGLLKTYHIIETNACAVYGVAAILAYYIGGPSYFNSVLNTCIDVAQSNPNYAYYDYYYQHWNYYINFGYVAPFANSCIEACNLNKYSYSSLLISKARTEISNGRPCLINIQYHNGYNVDHTVVAYQWKSYLIQIGYEEAFLSYFYRVKDGDCSTDRYVAQDAIVLASVTVIQ